MIAPALLVLFVLVAIVAIAAAGGPASSAVSPPPHGATGPTGSPVDWHARYVVEHELARRRLRLAGYFERQRNQSRARLRRYIAQHGTGVPFLDEALCVHSYESVDWHQRGHHFGGMQFNVGTWRSAGGYGNPADAHPVEQLYRAFLVWRRDGESWREWSTAPLCGLR